MKNILFVILLNLVLPLILIILLPSLLITTRHGTSQEQGDQTTSFIKDHPFEFSFVSNLPNLHSLSLRLKNPQIKNTSRIVATIIGPNSQQSLTFSGANVGDPTDIPLKFSPFADPISTKYTLHLSTDNLDPNSLYLITDSTGHPIFTSYYQQSNFKANLVTNFQRQVDLIHHRPLVYTIIYLILILIVDYQILFLL